MSKNELRSSRKLRKERFCEWRAVNWQIDAARRSMRLVERNKL